MGSKRFWQEFNNARNRGNSVEMLSALNREFKIKGKSDYKRWIKELRGSAKPRQTTGITPEIN